MTNFLELIFFVLYDEKYEYKVLEAQSILDWIAASKEKIEKGPDEYKGLKDVDQQEESKSSNEDADDSQYSSESSEDEVVDFDMLKIFVDKMSNYEE